MEIFIKASMPSIHFLWTFRLITETSEVDSFFFTEIDCFFCNCRPEFGFSFAAESFSVLIFSSFLETSSGAPRENPFFDGFAAELDWRIGVLRLKDLLMKTLKRIFVPQNLCLNRFPPSARIHRHHTRFRLPETLHRVILFLGLRPGTYPIFRMRH
jgi:hypothetical protein